MYNIRKDVWATKMVKPKVTTTPDLKFQPPTTEAFEQNVRRALMEVGPFLLCRWFHRNSNDAMWAMIIARES